MSIDGAVLIIFARAPLPGRVKTRLIPHVGAGRAAEIYRDLLAKTLHTALHSGFSAIQLWIDGDSRHPYFDNIANRAAIEILYTTGR